MKFVLLVKSHPLAHSALNAYRFANALMHSEHSLDRIFFHGEGVFTASSYAAPPQDESDLHSAWARLITDYRLCNTVCIASALRRGVLDDTEARRYDKPSASILAPFQLGGLGDLIEATHQADRVVTFN